MPASKTILVVDDEKKICDLLCVFLIDEGHKALSANDGLDALELISKNTFDLIISDIRMPRADGIYLLQQIRQLGLNVPVVFLTGFSDLTEAEAMHLGADGIFHKPINFEIFLKDIQRFLIPMSERFRRQNTRFPIVSDLKSTPFIVKNIGRGGAFIHAEKEFPQIGDIIKFQFTLEKMDLNGSGIVRWVRKFADGDKSSGFGIEFLER